MNAQQWTATAMPDWFGIPFNERNESLYYHQYNEGWLMASSGRVLHAVYDPTCIEEMSWTSYTDKDDETFSVSPSTLDVSRAPYPTRFANLHTVSETRATGSARRVLHLDAHDLLCVGTRFTHLRGMFPANLYVFTDQWHAITAYVKPHSGVVAIVDARRVRNIRKERGAEPFRWEYVVRLNFTSVNDEQCFAMLTSVNVEAAE